MKIAVIGGGIFGSVVATFLANQKHQVTLFEKEENILQGASSNNQNRLHLGFHYPRDLETAIQSKNGYEEFRKYFPEACVFDFPCYYGLSITESKTDFDQYAEFMKRANLDFEMCSTKEIKEYGFNISTISHLWRCREGVVDNSVLRSILLAKISQSGVKLSVNNPVLSILKMNDCWQVVSHKNHEIFDVVIKSTYGLDSIVLHDSKYLEPKSIYQATLVLEMQLRIRKFGLTIVDGDFLTILPKGFTNNFLVYSPKPSVMAQSFQKSEVIEILNSSDDISRATEELLETFQKYFQGFKLNTTISKLITVRNIDANSTKTDKRVSKIEKIDENFYNIRSGKIDHAIGIAKELSLYLN
jgi:glycine/D-amino acid oxidase-like deaminating enzyme